ncbi:hypothetical protein BDV23DRAFT_178813 [Aspergillus alliaceus]|uniref:GXWXG protein-domain-containing protein n=1 Tax=Petromyces alliaceus TaxID=209559 RepID=A0A5N7CM12_PETAA|nr:hypothetical protein BDV23DRAFT_178813 [Aspergillus alliaceus]
MADVDNLITLVRQKQKTNVQDVAMVFDALPPIEPECLLGVWSGDLVETGHKDIKLREARYRGVVSAAMIYDERSSTEVFQRLDENALLGAVDSKGDPNGSELFFVLERFGDFK